MAKVQFQSVNDYIRSQPDAIQDALAKVRRAIRKAAPDADEIISYNMPTYKIRGRSLVHFAAWKSHFSLYAASESILEKFKADLRGYTIEKGTIRFPLSEPVPEKLIERIVRFRAAEVQSRA